MQPVSELQDKFVFHVEMQKANDHAGKS